MTTKPAPYHFVPVEPAAAALDAPVFHDHLGAAGDFWSGELLCTMSALTPLLAANDQFELGQAEPHVRTAYHDLAKARLGANFAPGDKLGTKKLLEPLFAPSGEVLIPGAALKGAVRGGLSALLSAPMERAAERTFSFRPNIKSVVDKQNPIRTVKPALVVGGGGWKDGKPEAVRVIVLGHLRDVCYVHPEAAPFLPRLRTLPAVGENRHEPGYTTPDGRRTLRVTEGEVATLQHAGFGLSAGNILRRSRPNDVTQRAGWLPVVNLNGLDLDAELNRRHHEQADPREIETKSAGGYPYLLLNLPRNPSEVPLPDAVLLGFYDTVRHLCDTVHGHIRGGHPLVDAGENLRGLTERLRALLDRGLRPGDVLFLEEARLPGGKPEYTLAPFGFYGRWRYTGTVHHAGHPADRAKSPPPQLGTLRDILCPPALERESDADGRPKKLSAARLMFGFVGTSKGEYRATETMTFGIGLKPDGTPSDFNHLAGRVAINAAVEQDVAGKEMKDRFLNAAHEWLVPFRPLGSPKASAVEHYVTQDRLANRQDAGILCTYGETPDDPAAGQLRGRKFYLHQPSAATNPQCFELIVPTQKDWAAGPDAFHLTSDIAGVGRFVSKPNRQFKFAVRAVNLRKWELGGLFLALGPTWADVQTILLRLPDAARLPLGKWIAEVGAKKWDTGNLFATKLGHGRPLGLGSVRVGVDKARKLIRTDGDRPFLVDEAGDALRRGAVEALVVYLTTTLGGNLPAWVERVLVPWLKIHRYAGRTQSDYPRAADGTIHGHHTEVRQTHADRRKRQRQGTPVRHGLPDLN